MFNNRDTVFASQDIVRKYIAGEPVIVDLDTNTYVPTSVLADDLTPLDI